jgi:predicted transcriptional regulator
MPTVEIRQRVWNDLVEVAEKQRRKPDALANQALADYLERISDEKLLARSGRASRRAPLRAADTEAAIRRYRRKK